MKNTIIVPVIATISLCSLYACMQSGEETAIALGGGDEPADMALDLGAAWSEAQIDEILALTQQLHLAPDLSGLQANERQAVDKLLAVGAIFNDLYELSRHPQALQSRAALAAVANSSTEQAGDEIEHARKLQQLYYVMKGPITSTLDNDRVPFLPADPERPGKNVYPLNVSKEELEKFLQQYPDKRAQILHLRSVVKRNNAHNRQTDLAALSKYPTLDRLHPQLRATLNDLSNSPGISFYASPYSVNYADEIMQAYGLLNEAAELLQSSDAAFAQFLRLRSRDLLADNYDGGDAAWVTSHFTGQLNAQIGSYETYDDSLYGVKSFFSFSLLRRDQHRTAELVEAVADIQSIEDALPYAGTKRIRADIPVGVYNIIADFGQARGTNTATILPNESHLSRQYGRTILIRGNILTNPDRFALGQASFNAAIDPAQHQDLLPEGNLYRTLWHEIGHYLGVDRTASGEDLDTALQDTADLLEEMKADLVSLFSAPRLHAKGMHSDERLKAIYASGILRVLQKNQPRRDQAYNTMQLIQWNWFLARKLLTFDAQARHLHINYENYPEAVTSLLAEVLRLQEAGDRDKAEAFVRQWTHWDDNLHGVIATAMIDKESYRYGMVTYEALEKMQ